MKLHNYTTVFCLLILTVGIISITSCAKEKSADGNDESALNTTTEPDKPEEMASNPPETAGTQEPLLGPTYKNLVDGNDISLEDMKAKGYVLVVDFWATWCPPCKMEIPWFKEFHEKYKDRKFAVIGISTDRGGERIVKRFVDKNKMNYPVIMVTRELRREYEKALGQPIRSIPTTFILNRAGKVVSTHVGVPRSADPKGVFEKEIEKLLGEV